MYVLPDHPYTAVHVHLYADRRTFTRRVSLNQKRAFQTFSGFWWGGLGSWVCGCLWLRCALRRSKGIRLLRRRSSPCIEYCSC